LLARGKEIESSGYHQQSQSNVIFQTLLFTIQKRLAEFSQCIAEANAVVGEEEFVIGEEKTSRADLLQRGCRFSFPLRFFQCQCFCFAGPWVSRLPLADHCVWLAALAEIAYFRASRGVGV